MSAPAYVVAVKMVATDTHWTRALLMAAATHKACDASQRKALFAALEAYDAALKGGGDV